MDQDNSNSSAKLGSIDRDNQENMAWGIQNITASEEKLHSISSNIELLQNILRVSRQMAEFQIPDKALTFAIDEALKLMGGELGYIVFMGEFNEIEKTIKRGRDGSMTTAELHTMSKTVLNEVIKSRQPVLVQNALMDQRFARAPSVIDLKLCSILCAPLLTKKRLIGAIYIENRAQQGQFSENDSLILSFLSNQIAAIAENIIILNNLEKIVADRTEKLLVQNNQLAELNLELDEILKITAHDLRTPLSASLLSLELARKSNELGKKDRTQSVITRAIASNRQMKEMIDQLLDVSQLEKGKLFYKPEKCVPAEILRIVCQSFDEQASLKNIQLIMNQLSEDCVWVDPDILIRVFENLLSNALKYSNQNTMISLSIESKGDEELNIIVEDQGQGFSEEDMKSIFQKYARLSARPTNGESSSGLGLFAVKKYIELMNGEITIHSGGKDLGSRFLVTLPILIA